MVRHMGQALALDVFQKTVDGHRVYLVFIHVFKVTNKAVAGIGHRLAQDEYLSIRAESDCAIIGGIGCTVVGT